MAVESCATADHRMYLRCLAVFLFLIQTSFATDNSSSVESRTSSSSKALIEKGPRSFRLTVCERRIKIMRCVSSNHVIFVEDAFYGRLDKTTCPASNSLTSNTRCRSQKAFYETWRRCQGRRYCRVAASNSIYGDPCRGTMKYLTMQYRCASPGSDTIGSCLPNSWGSWLNTNSPSGTGDIELLSTHRSRSRTLCSNPFGMQIQLARGGSFAKSGDAVRHSLAYGMACRNNEQPDRKCNDYKVRYCCLKTGPSPVTFYCPLPRLSTNLQVSPSRKTTFKVGEYVVYSCRNGYSLEGRARVTCSSNSKWSHPTPKCVAEASGCGKLTAPNHGSVSSTKSRWNVNERANFSCDSGYTLRGSSYTVCLKGGFWSRSTPTCVARTSGGCGGTITGKQSGRITSPNYPNSYPDSKECVWQIRVGQGQNIELTIVEMDIEQGRQCRYDYLELYNGTSRFNTHINKICGRTKNRVYGSNSHIVSLRFKSDRSDNGKGFLLTWKVTGGGATSCPTPVAPKFGSISPSRSLWQPGSYVTYSCLRGYKLKGVARQQCSRSGAWSHSAPTCVSSAPPKAKRCYAVGDPHYRTFDGKKYDFQGICSYTLVKTLSPSRSSHSSSFVVEVDNEHRGGNKRVSWLRKVYIRMSGLVVELLKGRIVKVAGAEVNLPFNHASTGLSIRASGRFVVVRTNSGMRLLYDGRSYLTVELPPSFSGKVEGLCGDYNGNPDDDFRRTGSDMILTNPNEFAAQHRTKTKTCAKETPEEVTCSASKKRTFTSSCSILTKRGGCFANCHSIVDPQPFLHDCVFDACAYDDATTAIDNNVGAYAQICREQKVDVCITWRNDTKTELTCKPNSHYSACMSACPRTCSSSSGATCQESCVEGCECDEGYMLSGTDCVPRSACGCTYESQYYKNGETFYKSSCSKKCTCSRGRTSCTSARCQSGERCGRDERGRPACVPTGYGICKAWGDPHYMTLDGSGWFDFMGTCTYIMSRTHRLRSSDPRWFSITATNEHRGKNTRVSFLRSITITMNNGENVVELGKNRVIKVNDEVVKSYTTDAFHVKPSGRSVRLRTVHGLTVVFNGNGLRIKVSSSYRGKVHGVCGNFNGRKNDDLEMQSGKQTTSFTKFAQSYRVGDCDGDDPEPFICSASDTRKWGADQYCGALTSRRGVFSSCQSVVDAKTFFQKCVFDLCATNGDLEILTQALETYAGECQTHDIEICDWRDKSGAERMNCPRNSHYEGCSSPCPDTCADPYASANCAEPGQVEDCVCNVGYVRDGDDCVRRSECGCVIDGAYIGKGGRFVARHQNRECACLGQNQYQCSCIEGYAGTPCRDINECERSPCDSYAQCTNTPGSYTCECNDGYNGDGKTCTADAECSSPEVIDNGSFSPPSRGSRPVGSVVRYRCNRGYVAVGDTVIKCEEGGDWSADAPTCQDKDECDGNVCHKYATCSNTEGSYTCTCNEGYSGNGKVCSGVTCSPLTNPIHGSRTPFINGRHTVSTSVQYKCDNGYRLDGQSQLICLPTGQWTSVQPTCVQINECVDRSHDCSEFADCIDTNGSFKCKCKPGYTGDGRTCAGNKCKLPRLPRRGGVVPSDVTTFNKGDTIRYVCQTGYEIRGIEESTCGETGSWSSVPPTCVDINECSLGIDTCDENAECSNTIGSYTCKCEAGFFGDGESCSVVTCSAQSAPTNGAMKPVSPSTFEAGLTLTFTCKSGYRLEGSESITCMQSGLWTERPPTCTDIDECEDNNPCHKDAICRNTEGQHQCRCKQGYQGDGVFCSPITCEFPGKPTNGKIVRGERTEYRPGNALEYECNAGYTLSGESSITCQNSGQWTDFPPECKDIDECVEDLNPCHSEARCDNTVGGYECTCNEGFQGDGDDCQEITCGELPVSGNVILSLVKTTYPVGTDVTFSCEDGYILDGSSPSRCKVDGTWSVTDVSCVDINECSNRLDTPCDQNAECTNTIGSYSCACNEGYRGNGLECELVQCPTPVAPANGYFSPTAQTTWGVSDTVSYGCNNGYSRNGASSATCLDSGLWSEDAPTCDDDDECSPIQKPCDANADCENTDGSFRCECQQGYTGNGFTCEKIQCRDLEPVPNSNRKPRNDRTWFYGDVVTYTCVRGYERTGAARLTCLGSETWSDVEPSCIDIDECASNDPCDPSATCTNTAGSYTCQCNEGYTGNGGSCDKVTCRRPFPKQNGIFTPDNLVQYVVSTEVTYSCLPGYEIIENEITATCQENGRWSIDEPSCHDIDECQLDGSLCGEGAECINTDGSYRCTCLSGYTGEGATCNKINCPDLGEISYGFLTTDAQSPYVVGDEVFYECNAGFTLFGSSRLECMLNGLWSNSPPSCFDINECQENTDDCDVNAKCTNNQGGFICDCNRGYSGDGKTCVEIRCDEPVIPDNGYLSTQSQTKYTLGTRIAFACDDGYTLEGSARAVCEDTSSWSEVPPTCVDKDECADPDNTPCSEYATCTNTPGSYTCTCFEGYFGNGVNCREISCVEPSPPASVIVTSSATPPYVFGNSVQYDCKVGYTLMGQSSATCLISGLWSNPEPKCVDIDECESSPCDPNAECVNTRGSFLCFCNEKYSGNGLSCSLIECPRPDQPRLTTIFPASQQAWTAGSTARYSCPIGYQLIGSRILTCMDNGGWSTDAPTCRDSDECKSSFGSPCDASATCTNTDGSFECQCNEGYIGEGRLCRPVMCDRPASIDFGSFVLTDGSTVMGSSVLYKCSKGYALNGEASATCLSGGVWSEDPPTCVDIDECGEGDGPCDPNADCLDLVGGYRCDCREGYKGTGEVCQKIECLSPRHIANGDVIPRPGPGIKYFVNDEIQYLCDDGYSLLGNSRAICQLDGTYSEPRPSCVDVDECENPLDNPCHSQATCDNLPGTFFCSCNPGYRGDGTTCTEITCDALKNPANGRIENNQDLWRANDQARFTCNSGYKVLGKSSITCRESGLWSPNPPTCRDVDECIVSSPCDLHATCTNTPGSFTCACDNDYTGDGLTCTKISCPKLKTIDNGLFYPISTNYHVNIRINYRCNSGYALQGNAQLICTDTGSWSHDEPTCEDVDECSASRRPCDLNARCENTKGSFTCTCLDGYSGNGIFCQEIQCAKPDNVRYASLDDVKVMYSVDDIVTYTCQSGYRISGSAQLVCQNNGDWSDDEPTCADIDECADGICHTNADCTNFPGGYTCSCSVGYSGDGKECNEITCAVPDLPTGVSLIDGKNSYTFDETVSFKCSPGYMLSGPSSVSCTENGWSDRFPRCTDVDECRDNPCDINASCDNVKGTFVCSCNKGYSGDGRKCTRIVCRDVSAPTDGVIVTNVKNQYVEGNRVVFRCSRGYELVGSSVITCGSDGLWSNEEPTCTDIDECADDTLNACHQRATCSNEAGSYTCACMAGYSGNGFLCNQIKCPLLRAPTNGGITSDRARPPYMPNDVVTYSCTKGYKLDGATDLTCRADGSWSSLPPSCIDIDECTESSSPCDLNADCSNTVGSYECTCRQNYLGDGSNCQRITCRDIIAPRQGSMTSTSSSPYTVGDEINFDCDDGYSLSGINSISCLATGYWSASVPKCVDINECFDSANTPCAKDATCENTDGSYTCTCDERYSGDGKSCSLIECPTPVVRAPATIISRQRTKWTIGDFVRYSCPSGYRMDGSDVIRCLPSGTWSTDAPSCVDIDECQDASLNVCAAEATCSNNPGSFKCTCNDGYFGDGYSCSPVQCDRPDRIDYGTVVLVDGSTAMGNQRMYRCNDGFRLVGVSVSTCLDSGLWSDEPPTCTDIDECDESDSPCDVNADCLNNIGSYECLCRAGYTGSGKFCNNRECPPLVAPAYGSLAPARKTKWFVNDEAEFSCGSGTILFGDEVLLCLESGTWSNEPPTCEDLDECNDADKPCDVNADCENTIGSYKCTCNGGYRGNGKSCDEIVCDAIPAPVNGFRSSEETEFSSGETVTFSCTTGYQIKGRAQLRCLSGGVWSSNPPTCVDTNECLTSAPCDVHATCANNVGSFECTCNRDYTGDGRTCTKITCDPLNGVENGVFFPNLDNSRYDVNSVVRYACNRGYQPRGNTALICNNKNKVGVWSSPEPTCVDIDECNDPDLFPCDTNAKCDNTIGGYTCECNDGYSGSGIFCEAIQCRRPDDVRHATLSDRKLNYAVGESVTYTCATGYAISGEATITCQSSRLWSDAEPSCVDINECLDPSLNTCDENASCLNVPSSYSCTCNDRYNGDGTTCTLITCGDPFLSQYTSIVGGTRDVYAVGDEVVYVCDEGFTMQGPRVIECLNSGIWSGLRTRCTDVDECRGKPCGDNAACINEKGTFSCVCNRGFRKEGDICKRTTCAELNAPTNGRITTAIKAAYFVDDVISFRCQRSYALIGERVLTCEEDGTWSNTVPVCQDLDECADKTMTPCHPQATCTNEDGGFICTCNDGYDGNGFFCSEIKCPTLSSPVHGSINPNKAGPSLPNDVVTYSCDDGYMLSSDGELTCESGGSWSDPPPTCIDINECEDVSPCHENANCVDRRGSFSCSCKAGYSGDGFTCDLITCDELPDITYGTIAYTSVTRNVLGSSLRYKCNSGYTLVGSSQTTCTETGVWSNDPPTCVDFDECSDSSQFRCSPKADCTNTKGSYTCTCQNGYKGDGQICEKLRCAQPDIPSNGRVVGGIIFNYYDVGKSVIFTCATGYEIEGTETITCTSNEVWSPQEPSCKDINECADPTKTPCDPNAACDNTEGGFTCTCNDGYRQIGRTCELITCRDVAVPSDGSMTSESSSPYVNGNVLNFDCDEGFTLRGSSRLECLSTGLWSHLPPVCVDNNECIENNPCDSNAFCQNRIGGYTCTCFDRYVGDGKTCTLVDCGNPGEILNGKIILRPLGGIYVKGSRVQYRCNNGYTLVGEETLTCSDDGSWSSDLPTCQDINECNQSSDPPCDPNATCQNNDGGFTCTCNEGYDGSGRFCQKTICSRLLNRPRYGSITLTNLNVAGSEATFSCNDGFSLQGEQTLVCQNDGDWSGDEPTCQDIDECTIGTHTCDSNAECENRVGSYRCICRSGYEGDGFKCTETVCILPSIGRNVILVSDRTRYVTGDEAEYRCSEGYTLAGSRIIECTDTGRWADFPPTCVDVDECADSPCDENASCTNSKGTFQCSCNNGYTGDGTTCIKIECPVLRAPDNGAFSSRIKTTYVVGNIVNFRCNLGYTLVGRNSLSCQGSGQWSHSVPKCTDVDECEDDTLNSCHRHATCTNNQGSFACSCNDGYTGNGIFCNPRRCLSPKIPTNGYVQGNFIFSHYDQGSTVTFLCRDGYEISGNSEITCLSTGEWSLVEPTCVDIKECSDPNNTPCDPNADCEDLIGSYRCSCKNGYRGNGKTCTRITCRDLLGPLNGRITAGQSTEYTLDSSLTFACNDGFRIRGSTVLTCQRSGFWDNQPPLCIDINECSEGSPCDKNAFCQNTKGSYSCTCLDLYSGDGATCELIDCGNPGSINNGRIVLRPIGNFVKGSRVQYKCNDGYQLTGTNPITCEASGSWSSVPPSCIDIDECSDSIISPCDVNAQCVNTVGAFECNCNDGYASVGGVCDEIQCRQLFQPRKGTLVRTDERRIGSVATFTCTSGYVISGDETLVCESSGLWSGTEPTCTDVDECADDVNPCGDNARCTNTKGSFSCFCNIGYTSVKGVCERITCLTRSAPDNGEIVNAKATYYATDRIVYRCANGYELSGIPVAFCTEDGTWSSDAPTCQDIDECANVFNTPCAREARCDNIPGSFTCTCNAGYVGSGSFCQKQSCPALISIRNGRMASSNAIPFSVGDVVTYTCNSGFDLEGSQTSECLSDGVWSSNPPSCTDVDECSLPDTCSPDATCSNMIGSYKCTCKFGYNGNGKTCTPVQCDRLRPPFRGALSPSLPIGQKYNIEVVVTFECDTGYRLRGSGSATCLRTGLWSNSVPTCVDDDECADPSNTPCPSHSTCSNTVGGFTCECDTGYFKEGDYCRRAVCIATDNIPRATHGPIKDEYVFNDKITYVCSNGYAIRGSAVLTCQLNGEWDHALPSCEDLDECQQRVCHVHATCTNSAGSYSCQCNRGYLGEGDSCTAINCGQPPSIDNGYPSPRTLSAWTVGIDVIYRCNPGYQIVGAAVLSCRDNGVLSSKPPTCEDFNECDNPADNKCSEFASCFNTVGSYTCECNEGYTGDGLYCERLACSRPDSPTSGYFRPSEPQRYATDAVVVYSCNGGYRVAGPPRASCQSDGSWMPPAPPACDDIDECQEGRVQCHTNADCINVPGTAECKCKEGYRGDGQHCQQVTCNPPPTPNRGGYSPRGVSQYNFDQKITYHCNSGFKIVGETTSTCQESGFWSLSSVTCADIDECREGGSDCHSSALCLNNYGSHSCQCVSPYTGDGRTCRLANCPNPVQVHRGSYQPSKTRWVPNDQVTYSCETGYVLVGSSTVTCSTNGQWSSQPPKCMDVNECLNSNPCHRLATCINTDGSYKCQCQHGHFGDGTSCTLVMCTEPNAPLNGNVSPKNQFQYRLGTVISYYCNGGYQITGEAQARCMDNQEWSYPEPTCDDLNECQLDNPPCDENAICVNTIGSYECSCKEGYLGDGRHCRVPVCQPPSTPNGGSFTTSDSTYKVGTVVTFQCSNGYFLKGNDEIQCINGPIWSGNSPLCDDIDECASGTITCHENAECVNTQGSYKCGCSRGYTAALDGKCILVTCGNPPVLEKGTFTPATQDVWTFGDTVTYRCNDGFTLEGSGSTTCEQNGQWDSPAPTCTHVRGNVKYCTVSGDPHYDTFDGNHYEYQGGCIYDLVSTIDTAESNGLTPFAIESENEIRFGLTHVTWLKRIIFKAAGKTVELRKNLLVMIDGVATTLPYTDIDSGLEVRMSGRYVTVNTGFGAHLRYDGDHYFTVGLPAEYQNSVKGLCGNYNGIEDDDLQLRGSNEIASSSIDFGNSHQISSSADCAAAIQSDDVCTAGQRAQYAVRCQMIREAGGCFDECHASIDPLKYYEDCIFDLCAFGGDQQAVELNVAAYAAQCQGIGATICPWRTQIRADLICPAHSTYKLCTSACPNTCVDETASQRCFETCIEGCECDEGFLLSGDECVPAGQCGCQSEGKYYKSGTTFLTSACRESCTCLDGVVECTTAGCPSGQRCAPDADGNLGCKKPTASCNAKPIPKMIQLPRSCSNADNSIRYVDVGTCPSVTCPRSNSFVTPCCGAVDREMEAIQCRDGSTIRVSKVTKCGCSQCTHQTITVTGKVFGVANDGSHIPLRFGFVVRNNRSAATTNNNGMFTINVDSDEDRLVLTFIDKNNELMTTTKVIPFKQLGGDIFHYIRVPRKAPSMKISARDRGSFSPSSSSGQSNVITIDIEPNSYFAKDGDSYRGDVTASLTYIDPRDATSYMDAPSDLLTEDGRAMRCYGMFDMDFRNYENRELDVRNIRVSMLASHIGIDSDRQQVRMWSLDPVTGLWVDEGRMSLTSSSRGTVVTANIPLVRSRRLLNIDVPAARSCFAKVRAYGSNDFNVWDQISYVLVTTTYRESSNSQWRAFGSALTRPDTGACLRVFCDIEQPGAFTASFTATLNAKEDLEAAPSNPQNPNIIGISTSALQRLDYRRGDHSNHQGSTTSFTISVPETTNRTHLNGPFYRDEFDCIKAPNNHNHFRFSRKSSASYEFNSIPIDENNIFFTWQDHPLIWWPNPTQFKACFMKVKFLYSSPVSLQSRCNVGTRPGVLGQLYGIRETTSVSNSRESAACIEFKCSSVSLDGHSDRSLVAVTPGKSSCRRHSINSQLSDYLETRLPLAGQTNQVSYRMYAPPDLLGQTYGIYTNTASDPVTAKRFALGHCMAGESRVSSDTMKIGDNVAVTFKC